MSGKVGLLLRSKLNRFCIPASVVELEIERNSAAERAGLLSGDILKSIDGLVVDGWDIDRITERLRGDAGTWVKIGVCRFIENVLFVPEFFVQREPQVHSSHAHWLHTQGFVVNSLMGVNNNLHRFGTSAATFLTDSVTTISLKTEPMRFQPISRPGITLPIEGVKCGLANMGNTCFLNSIVQCLAHLTCFSNWLLFNNLDEIIVKKDSAVLKTFVSLLGHLWSSQDLSSLKPVSFLAALKADNRFSELMNHKQQDAHEFLCLLLDVLHEDTNGAVVTEPPHPDAGHTPLEDGPSAPLAQHLDQLTLSGGAGPAAVDPHGANTDPYGASSYSDWEDLATFNIGGVSPAAALASASPFALLEGADWVDAGLPGSPLHALDELLVPPPPPTPPPPPQTPPPPPPPMEEWGVVSHSEAASASGCGAAARLDSVVSNFLGGRLCSQVTCNGCGYSAKNEETFFVLSVPLPPRRLRSHYNGLIHLEECLELMESEGSAVSWVCASCGRQEATQRLGVGRFPRCLAIHLKRFAFEQGRRFKRDDEVIIPVDGLHCPAPSLAGAATVRGGGAVYNLSGWCEHQGTSDTSGHYVAVARGFDGVFLRYNDESVAEASTPRPPPMELSTLPLAAEAAAVEEAVTAAAEDARRGGAGGVEGRWRAEKRVVSRAAYLLFYERADLAQ